MELGKAKSINSRFYSYIPQ